MLLDVVQDVFYDDALGDEVAVVGRVAGCVGGDEHVGHDSAAAIDGAVVAEGVVGHGFIEVDRVGVPELAGVVPVEEVELVFLALAFLVGFLYAAARRGVVARCGEAYHGAVGEWEGALDETLAEGAAPDDEAAVVFLDCPREDFGSRGRVLVDHDDEAVDGDGAGVLDVEVCGGGVEAFCEYDGIAFTEEFGGELVGRAEVSAAVAGEVENEVAHAQGGERVGGLADFAGGRFGEACDGYEAGGVVDEV